MVFLLNLLFAFLAFFVVRYLFLEMKVQQPLATVVAALAAVIVFLANIAGQVW